MLLCKLLWGLCMGAWFCSQPDAPVLPSQVQVVNVVKITNHVCQAPAVWPTVTVTERIGIPATSIDHTLPTTISSQAIPRRVLRPYEYSFPELADSPLQLQFSFGEWLLEEKYSPFEILAFLSACFFVGFLPFVISCLTRSAVTRAVHSWYHNRAESKRISMILERGNFTGFTIMDCLFPAIDDLPHTPSRRDIVRAIYTDVVHFMGNLIALGHETVVMLGRHTWSEWPRRIRDIVIIINANVNVLHWRLFLLCFRSFWTEFVVRILWFGGRKAFGLVPGMLSMSWLISTEVIKAGCRIFIGNILCRSMSDEYYSEREFDGTYSYEVFLAYKEAANMSWEERAMKQLEYEALRNKRKELELRIGQLEAQVAEKNVMELAAKAIGYRNSLVEAIRDLNYLRTLVCCMLNHNHNVKNGMVPDGPHAEHPYQPSQVRFRTEPHAETKLFFELNPWTEAIADIADEYNHHVKGFYWNKQQEELLMPFIVNSAMKERRGPYITGGMDPFKKDESVIKANYPGIHISPYKKHNTPFNVDQKRPQVMVDPTKWFGVQIEDVALQGRLAEWCPGMKKVPGFSADELRKFTNSMPMGAPMLKPHHFPTVPRVQAYADDPCPTGEPVHYNFS